MALLCCTRLVSDAHGQVSNKLIAVDNEGNVHVAGPNFEEMEIGGTLFVPHEPLERWAFVAKLSGSGEVIWARQLGGSGYEADGITGLAVDDDGNGYISGAFPEMGDFDGLESPTSGLMVLKFDVDGEFEWSEGLGFRPFDVIVDANGVGRVVGTDGFESSAYWSAAVDDEGNTLWRHDGGIGTGRSAFLWAVAADGAGYVSQIGFSNSTSFVRHEDSNGNENWVRLIEPASSASRSRAMAVDVDVAGNTYVGGQYGGTLQFDTDVQLTGGTHFLAMYDPFGNVMWADNLPEMDVGNHLMSLAVDGSGQIHTAATVFDFSRDGSIGILLTGYEPGEGQVYSRYLDNVWAGVFASNFLDVHNNELYLAAGASDATQIADMTLLLNAPSSHFFVGKFDLNTQVASEDRAQLPRTARLLAPHPNPVASRGVVPFETDLPMPVSIRLYDVLGREVAVLMDATVPAGRHEVRFEPGALPGGVYVIRMTTSSGVDTLPITVMRR